MSNNDNLQIECGMTRCSILAILASLAIGCAPAEKASEPVVSVESRSAPGEQSVNPSPMGAGAGGLAPVQGSENVTGAGGGGVQQSAKDAARRAAGSAGGTTMPDGP